MASIPRHSQVSGRSGEATIHTESDRSDLVEGDLDICLLLNAEHTVVYASPSVTPSMGFPVEELMGRQIVTLVHPDDLTAMQDMAREVLVKPGQLLHTDCRLLCKDGSWRWFAVSEINLLAVPGSGSIVGNFRAMSRKKAAIVPNWYDSDNCGHFVQFYESDASLVETSAGFITSGLREGEAFVIIATPEHLQGLDEKLAASGVDLASARDAEKYRTLNAAETLAQLMIDGLPDRTRFRSLLGSILQRLLQHQHTQRIYILGEMVALLWQRANPEGVIVLEKLWNELQDSYPFTLCCMYPLNAFSQEAHGVLFSEICDLHTQVIPGESYTTLTNVSERFHAISLLQQQACSLKGEIAGRKVIEEQLRFSENRYRRLFESARDGIFIIDPMSGKIIDANSFISTILGYPHEQLLGQELWQLGLVQNSAENEALLVELRQCRTVRYEVIVPETEHRQRRDVELVCNNYRANGRQIIQCNVRDITTRKQAEETRLHLAAIVESSDDAIFSKDMDGIITSWNAAAERMYGYSAQEIIGRSVKVLFLPGQDDEFLSIMSRIKRGEYVDHYETTRIHKDGKQLTASVTVSPIKNSRGIIIGASTIARNITEQRQLEMKFRRLFDSNIIGVFVVSIDGTFLDANHSFLSLLGYTREDLQAGRIHTAMITPAEFQEHDQQVLNTLQETSSPGVFEKEYLHKDGHRVPVMVALTGLGRTHTCMGIVLDISERKELDKRKDEFISMASHELKTPVTSLKGFTHLLQRRPAIKEDEKTLHYLERIDAQVAKLTTLINEMLDLSKMQSGQLRYHEEYFEMSKLVRETVEHVQETSLTHTLQLVSQTSAEVLADRDRIGQVLMNFLNNAMKYSPQADRVVIRMSLDEQRVIVRVQDFGIGIDVAHQQKIFERFYQVTDPEEKTYPGLGIGLYISSETIKRYGGQIWVESEKGHGSTFNFSLAFV